MESAHETNYEKLSAMLEKEAARVDEVLRKCQEEKEETKKTCKTLMDGASANILSQYCLMVQHTEIQSLREQTDKQLSTEVESLKAAQKEALDAVRAMTQETQIVRFPSTPHLSMWLTQSSC